MGEGLGVGPQKKVTFMKGVFVKKERERDARPTDGKKPGSEPTSVLTGMGGKSSPLNRGKFLEEKCTRNGVAHAAETKKTEILACRQLYTRPRVMEERET